MDNASQSLIMQSFDDLMDEAEAQAVVDGIGSDQQLEARISREGSGGGSNSYC